MRFIKILKVSDKRHSYGASNLSDCKFMNLTMFDILSNFKSVFGTDDVIVICDNSSDETASKIESLGFNNIIRTTLGPHDSTKFVFEKIVTSDYSDDDVVYICEDDYWHLEDSPNLILDGLTRADYVTLYDSLDKYINNGNNPTITEGGERTLVYLTKLSHWKYTISTTMTFAARVGTFKRDIDILVSNYLSDFRMFTILKNNNVRLASCIPGRAGHIGYEMPPFIDWDLAIQTNSAPFSFFTK
jgi:hypothetical protein